MVLFSKVLLISAGVVSLAVGLNFYVPFLMEEVPEILTLCLSWLKPPYIYVVINAIIFVLIASSRLHQSLSEPSWVRSEHLISVKTPPSSYYDSVTARPGIVSVVKESIGSAAAVYADEDGIFEVKPESESGNGYKVVVEAVNQEEEEYVLARSISTDDSPFEKIVYPQLSSPVREKPLLSSRFGHRKPFRTSHHDQDKLYMNFNPNEGAEGGEAQKARNAGKHMEGDNGGTSRSSKQAPQEIRCIGTPPDFRRRRRGSRAPIRDLQRAEQPDDFPDP